MSDKERDLKRRIERGKDAEVYWNDRRMERARIELREDVFLMYEKTAPDQVDEREQLYYTLWAMKGLEQRVKLVIQDGKKAEIELNGNRDK